jgi:hypothetical protein
LFVLFCQIQEMAIAATGSLAISSAAAFAPYFDGVCAGLLAAVQNANPDVIRVRAK